MGILTRTPPIVAASVLLAAVLASCAPEPPPSGLPACPARQEIQLEAVDPVNFSLPQAVSPDAGWVVLSRVVGTDFVLSLRQATAGSPSQPVGSLPYSSPTKLIGVGPNGSYVVFGVIGTGALPGDPSSVLQRWTASGTVSVNAPTVALPPPGVAYPVNAAAVSPDGARIVWSQTFREGPEPYIWHHVTTVTDASNDVVVAQYPTADGFFAGNWISSGGNHALGGTELVELDTGTVTDLGPELTAAQVAFPGPAFSARAVSDDGRYLVLDRIDTSSVPPLRQALRWDRVSGTGTWVGGSISTDYGHMIEAVTDSGSVMWAELSAPSTATVWLMNPGGATSILATSAQPRHPGFLNWAAESPELHTMVYSQAVLGGYRLVASRCT